jgi:hypothetical protein
MQANPERPVEAGKMIHVGVEHKRMSNAQSKADRWSAAPGSINFRQ